MTIAQRTTTLGVTALFAAISLAPISALADSASRQKHKNNWRNGAIAGGVVAGYGLLKHNTTATVLGAAGAAYSANRYEQERKHQDARKRARQRYHSRSRRYYHNNGNYRHNGTYGHTGNYSVGSRRYYHYDGHQYYIEKGNRHFVR